MRARAVDCHVEELTGRDVLDQLGEHLDVLAARLDLPLTSRRVWLSAWIAADQDYEPWAITAWNADDLVGACLLARRRVGDTVEVVALGQGRNDRTRLPALDDHVALGLANRLVDGLGELGRPWTLRLEQLPYADPVTAAVVDRLAGAALITGGSVPGVDFGNSRSVDAHLSRNLRRQLQKCRNRISNDGVLAEITFTRDPSTLTRLLDDVEEVHRARDHDVGRTSDIDNPVGLRLWRGIISRHLVHGAVEIATLHLDGTLAAYVVSFLDGATYRVFDGRFLTKWERYSPGRLLETETLARAMNDHRFIRLDWMNSIAPDKLISSNVLEATETLVGSSHAAICHHSG